jgi:hypothetical protein
LGGGQNAKYEHMSTDLYVNFEFLTGLQYLEKEYVGIVVNYDQHILTFYDVDMMPDVESKKEFLEMGEIWWWESNRLLPIDVFLHHEMKQFKPFLRTFVSKDVGVIFGPVTSLQNLLKKRVKRRSIQLIRKTT